MGQEKPVLFWAIVRRLCLVSEAEIVAVTSVKGSFGREQIYGRYADGAPTHRSGRDVLVRVDTRAEAEGLLMRVTDIRADYARQREAPMREIQRLRDAENEALRGLWREGGPQRPPGRVGGA